MPGAEARCALYIDIRVQGTGTKQAVEEADVDGVHYVGVDLDGDGTVDVVGVDRDGDGIADEWECGNECGFAHLDYDTVVAHEATCTYVPEAEGEEGAPSGFFASLHHHVFVKVA